MQRQISQVQGRPLPPEQWVRLGRASTSHRPHFLSKWLCSSLPFVEIMLVKMCKDARCFFKGKIC